tara:strand:- start:463 stop:660 length:198 start_codon:yes stop_codon:yes gene_type:complete
MKKYTHEIFGGEIKEVQTSDTQRVELLESNVRQLQEQLTTANKRIMQLNLELDFYKKVHTQDESI